MKNIKKKIWALMSAAVTTSTLVVSMTGSSVTNSIPRDPSGDGQYFLNDVVLINQFVNGSFNVTDLTALDYNKNGVISPTDALQLQLDIMAGNINTTIPTEDSTSMNDITLNETSRTYAVYQASNGNITQEGYSIDCCDTYNNSTTPYSVFGDTDDRVIDFTKSGVVKIKTEIEGDAEFGTGFIVGPHCIATAAHIVYSPESNNSAAIKNILSFNVDGSIRNDTITPLKIHIPTKFGGNNYYYDYALITVEEDLSNYPIFDLGVYDSMTDRDVTATITGFPEQIRDTSTGNWITKNDENNLHIMYSGNGTVLSSNGYQISHIIDSSGGNSGGPVYVTEYCNGTVKYTAFSLHNLSPNEQSNNPAPYNYAVQIDSNLINFYKNNPNVPE